MQIQGFMTIQTLSGATDIQADRETGQPKMFRIIIADSYGFNNCKPYRLLFMQRKHGTAQHIEI